MFGARLLSLGVLLEHLLMGRWENKRNGGLSFERAVYGLIDNIARWLRVDRRIIMATLYVQKHYITFAPHFGIIKSRRTVLRNFSLTTPFSRGGGGASYLISSIAGLGIWTLCPVSSHATAF